MEELFDPTAFDEMSGPVEQSPARPAAIISPFGGTGSIEGRDPVLPSPEDIEARARQLAVDERGRLNAIAAYKDTQVKIEGGRREIKALHEEIRTWEEELMQVACEDAVIRCCN